MRFPWQRSADAEGDEGPDSGAAGPLRWFPRSAWITLLVAIGVVAAVFIVKPDLLKPDPAGPQAESIPKALRFTKTIAGVGDPDGLRLDGFPANGGFTIQVPVDEKPTGLQVVLNGSSQIARSAFVVMTVSVDEQPVDERELPSGTHDLNIRADVPAGAADDGRLRISVTTSGELSNKHCTLDDGIGSLVHIEGASYVEGRLPEPVHTVRDSATVLDRDVTILVSSQLGDQTEQLAWYRALQSLGVSLTQSGHTVRYDKLKADSNVDSSTILVGPVNDLKAVKWSLLDRVTRGALAVGSVGDHRVLGLVSPNWVAGRYLMSSASATAGGSVTDPRSIGLQLPRGSAVSLEGLGASTAPQSILESGTWRVSYSVADLPGGRVPTRLSAKLITPTNIKGERYIVSVSLNGDLLASVPMGGGSTMPIDIALPVADQQIRNALTITVQRDRDRGGCQVRTTPYTIQLDPSSALHTSDAVGDGLVALPHTLSADTKVWLTADSLADQITTLDSTVSTLAEFLPRGGAPDVELLTAKSVPDGPFIQIGNSGDEPAAVPGLEKQRLISEARRLDIGTEAGTLIVAGGSVKAKKGSKVSGLFLDLSGAVRFTHTPLFGTEPVHVITDRGSEFVLTSRGFVERDPLARAGVS